MEYPSRLFGIAPTSVAGEYGFGDVAYERTSFAVREEGKEWVGTAAALWGITAGVYLALMGPRGMVELGEAMMARTDSLIHLPAGAVAINHAIERGVSGTAIKLRQLFDPDGKPTGLMPTILLTPPALSATASALYVATEIRDNTASTKTPTANIFANKYRPVVSRYLSNASYTGYSALAWYLLANPADMATIEVAFLNGQQSPTVETADADFNTLGIQLRGYHDFGVALQEYRAGYKAKGEA
jgi:hypothetical protein